MTSRGYWLPGARNIIAVGVTAAASLVLSILVARQLGTHALGEYALVGAVFGLFSVIDGARTQDLTARGAAGLAGHKHRVAISWACAVVAGGTTIGFGLWLGSASAETACLAWAGSIVMVATSEVVAAAQVANRFGRIATANAVGSVLGCATCAVLITHIGLPAAGLGLALNVVVPRVILGLDAPELPARVLSPAVDTSRSLLSLVLLNGAAQLVNFTDVVVIRGLSNATAVGRYRAGSQLPTQVFALLFRGYDVILPRLAEASDEVANVLLRRSARRLALVVGAAGGLMIGERNRLVYIVLGRHDPVAAQVLVLFVFVWLVNSVIHPASLLMIARRRQQAIVRFVWLEYAANAVLTVVLVRSNGVVGSALATLITLSVSNLIVIPVILARKLPSLPLWRHLIVDNLLPTALVAAVVFALTDLLAA